MSVIGLYRLLNFVTFNTLCLFVSVSVSLSLSLSLCLHIRLRTLCVCISMYLDTDVYVCVLCCVLMFLCAFNSVWDVDAVHSSLWAPMVYMTLKKWPSCYWTNSDLYFSACFLTRLMVALSSQTRIWLDLEGWMIHNFIPCLNGFFSSFFFLFFFNYSTLPISPVPLFRPWSVHSGSTNWDDCG